MALRYRRGYILLLCLLVLRDDFFRERHTTRRNTRRGGYNKKHSGEKTGPTAPIETQSLIHNISGRPLTPMEEGTLNKGLSFIPTPHI
ncbi:Hypothetical predicted protein, partial [Pelobates cultripes]